MHTLSFDVWAKFLLQNLIVLSKSPMTGQFHGFHQNLENQLCPPPTVQEIFFDMPGGLNLESPENLYHTICVVQRLSLLK